jgi:hypothetical protein
MCLSICMKISIVKFEGVCSAVGRATASKSEQPRSESSLDIGILISFARLRFREN